MSFNDTNAIADRSKCMCALGRLQQSTKRQTSQRRKANLALEAEIGGVESTGQYRDDALCICVWWLVFVCILGRIMSRMMEKKVVQESATFPPEMAYSKSQFMRDFRLKQLTKWEIEICQQTFLSPISDSP